MCGAPDAVSRTGEVGLLRRPGPHPDPGQCGGEHQDVAEQGTAPAMVRDETDVAAFHPLHEQRKAHRRAPWLRDHTILDHGHRRVSDAVGR